MSDLLTHRVAFAAGLAASCIMTSTATASSELVEIFRPNQSTQPGNANIEVAPSRNSGAYSLAPIAGDNILIDGLVVTATFRGLEISDDEEEFSAAELGDAVMSSFRFSRLEDPNAFFTNFVFPFASRPNADGILTTDQNRGPIEVQWTLSFTDLDFIDDTLTIVDANNTEVVFSFRDRSGSDESFRLENFRVFASVVPSPGTVMLAGIAGIAANRRRR